MGSPDRLGTGFYGRISSGDRLVADGNFDVVSFLSLVFAGDCLADCRGFKRGGLVRSGGNPFPQTQSMERLL